MGNYKLVFDGTISDGYQVEDVKKNLARLLKANSTQIERLFAKQEVVLKKGMDHDAAMKYQKALQKAGAVCKLSDASQHQGILPAEEAAPMKSNDQFIAEPSPATDLNFANESMMEIGHTTIPQEAAVQSSEDQESSANKIGRGIKDIIAGVVLIAIGLVLGGSIFLGNADALDIFFDCLGLFWIGSGIYKMVR